jgi:hypothetical protein
LSLNQIEPRWHSGIAASAWIAEQSGDLRNALAELDRNLGAYVRLVISVAYTLYIIYAGGDYMAMYRFFVPFLPFIYLLFGTAAAALFASAYKVRGRTWVARFVLALVLFTMLFESTPSEKMLFNKPILQHGHYQGVQHERWNVARLALIGKFFDTYKKSPSESLTTDAIGAIGFYADIKICDLCGLVDLVVAHMPFEFKKEHRWRLPGHERKQSPTFGIGKNSTYIMFNRNLTKEPIPLEDPERYPGYKQTSVWLVDDINKEEGYFTFLELIK